MNTSLAKKETRQSSVAVAKPKKQVICLLGFMAAGKTSLAHVLAEMLDARWIDLDEFIEARESRSIAQIIENLGESVFRELEMDALEEVLAISKKQACIVALGGGAWMNPLNRRLIKDNDCQTIWLDASFNLCWQRIQKSNVARPLARSEEQTRALFAERRKIYQTADLRIKITNNKSVHEIAGQIAQLLG